jgi:hypothetical protein
MLAYAKAYPIKYTRIRYFSTAPYLRAQLAYFLIIYGEYMIACVLEVACLASIALRWMMVDALKFCVILTMPFGAIDKPIAPYQGLRLTALKTASQVLPTIGNCP